MHRGYIKLWRKLQDSFFYKDPEYILLWIHLLFKANHIDHTFVFNGKKMTCKRGQLIAGRKKLSEETGINESKVNRIIKALKNEQQIEQQVNNRFSLITILKYEDYQGEDEQQDEQQMNSKRTASEQPVNTLKELKNDKNEKNTTIRFPFLDIWAKYPNRQGKSNAERHFKTTVKTQEDFNNIGKALENYLKCDTVKKGFIKNGSTWFNDWQSWVNPTPEMMGKTEALYV